MLQSMVYLLQRNSGNIMAQYKYRTLADKILADIESGRYPPGVPVPSSRELTTMFSVSQLTAVRALAYLARKGVLQHYQGRNYCVANSANQGSCRFITLLFRPISGNGREFYGNKIISGISSCAFSAMASCYFSSAATQYFRSQSPQFEEIIKREVFALGPLNIGVIADYFIPDEVLKEISMTSRLPIVVIGRRSQLPYVNSVVLDVVPAYTEMMSTLKRLGYNAFICCLYDNPLRDEHIQQKKFFRKIAGNEESMAIIEKCDDKSTLTLYEEISAYLQRFRNKRIAVILASDHEAQRMIHFLHFKGLKPQEDVGVVSFYNTRIATESTPVLSSIAVAPEELGKTAAGLILSGSHHSQILQIPMSFEFGGSV